MKKRIPVAAKDKIEIDYLDKLTPSERAFIEKFNHDFHCGGVYSRDTILKHKDPLVEDSMRKEARKNHDSLKRDALNDAITHGTLSNLNEETTAFMNEASDQWDYENVFAEQGIDAAVSFIINTCLTNLKNRQLDKRITLYRFYTRMRNLRKLQRKERAKQNK